MKKLGMLFNEKAATVMHIDFNACFASIEQQANPFLRGKPVAVCAYTTDSGCILASSYEAKRMGVKTGMRVKDGRILCPDLVVLPSDPQKYRDVHRKLKTLLARFTDNAVPKSIDEFVLDFEKFLPMYKLTMEQIAFQIKSAIKSEIGEALTVSIGIGPNRFLAKLGAGYVKPDGLTRVDKGTYEEIFKSLSLTDLCGIKRRMATRLNSGGISSVWGMYNASPQALKAALRSIQGYYWYMRLHGFEIDDAPQSRKTYGNSYSLPKPLSTPRELSPVVAKLTLKMSSRVRRAGLMAGGLHLGLQYKSGKYWHEGRSLPKLIISSSDFYNEIYNILQKMPPGQVRLVSVTAFKLSDSRYLQPDLFDALTPKVNLTTAMDSVNDKMGAFTIAPARVFLSGNAVPDRIAFGNVKELEEIT